MVDTPTPADKRSALAAAYLPGSYGASGERGPGVVLRELRGLNVVHIAGDASDKAFAAAVRTETGCALPTEPNTAAVAGSECTVLWLAPERWLVVSARHGEGLLEERFRLALASGSAAVTDVSSGRTVIRVSGRRARELLAKNCPIDLHERAFTAGGCAGTNALQIAVLLHALDSDTIDVYVARGFAQSLWEQLTEGAAEYGYRVDPAHG